MLRRVVVTGGRGFVAGGILTQLAGVWDATAISRGPSPSLPEGVTWFRGDILDREAVLGLFQTIGPDAVIHVAAMAGIDDCQAHMQAAHRINVDATRNVASICRELGIRMVFVSSDNVFDGNEGLYGEDDETRPLNYYGETKLEAERAVLAELENAVVARVALVMGLPLLGEGNSFLSRMIRVLKAGERLGVPDTEVRSPIDIVTLGRTLLELAGASFTGTLHLAGTEVCDRFNMAATIADHLGYDASLVFANDPTDIPGRAERPRDVSLSVQRAQQLLNTPLVGIRDGLELVLAATGPSTRQ